MTIFCQWIHFLPIFCASQFINVPQFKKQTEHCSVNSDELTENQCTMNNGGCHTETHEKAHHKEMQ